VEEAMKRVGKIFLWFVAILFVIEVAAIAVMWYSRRIRPATVLTYRIEGVVSEQPPRDVFSELALGPRTTVSDVVESLDRARRDPRITGIELRVSESTLGFANIQEIREKIREFNRSGKFSVAYLEFGTNRSYYLASACQTVVLLPKSTLFIRGLMTSSTFFRGTFDKLGIYPDIYHVGEYKSAKEIYTEKKYTPAHREAAEALLKDFSRQFVRHIAENRGLSVEEAERAIAQGPLSSEEALKLKLVDRVAYSDEVRELIRGKNAGKDNVRSYREYLRRSSRGGASKLAVIFATGTILPGRSTDNPLTGEVMGSETMAEQFRRAREDSSVRAVVVRVNSPGGAVFPSEAIRREVELTRNVKPVVVSMSDVAASGGYWIAVSANKIVAEPGTVTGSIGVVGGKFNLKGLYEKFGLSKDFIATTENSTIEYPFQNFTPAQREKVQTYMRQTYDDFVQGVAEGRGMDVAAVEKVARGRVWTGERAQELGLVDELGGLDAAIAAAKELAQIPADETVSLLYLPPPRPLLDRLLDVMSGVRAMRDGLSVREWLARLESLAGLGAWALLPAVPQAQ
jgi:protease-4